MMNEKYCIGSLSSSKDHFEFGAFATDARRPGRCFWWTCASEEHQYVFFTKVRFHPEFHQWTMRSNVEKDASMRIGAQQAKKKNRTRNVRVCLQNKMSACQEVTNGNKVLYTHRYTFRHNANVSMPMDSCCLILKKWRSVTFVELW